MSKKSGLKYTAIAVASVLAMAGCSDGSVTANDSRSDEYYAEISGIAVKGLVRKALVTAVELDGSGVELRALGATQTDDAGAYTFKLTEVYQGGPIQISVTADEDTTMVCDVHSDSCELGQSVAVEDGFEMNAILPEAGKGDIISLDATPVSHMAAEFAKANPGGVNAAAVRAAISEVSQLVGVDIASTRPIDLTVNAKADTATADEKVYAAFIAGIGRIALENPEGLNAGLSSIGRAFNDGKLDDTDRGISVAQILDTVKSESNAFQLGADSALASLNSRSPNGVFDPEAFEVLTGDVAKGKALLEDVRTWLSSLADTEEPLQAFSDDARLASELFEDDVEHLTAIFTDVLKQIEINPDDEGSFIGQHKVFIGQVAGERAKAVLIVTVSEANDEGGVRVFFPSTEIYGTDVTMSLNVTTNLPDEAVSGEPFSLDDLDLTVSASVFSDSASIDLKETSVVINATETFEVEEGETPEIGLAGVSINGEMEVYRDLPAEDEETPVRIFFTGKAGLAFVQNAVEDSGSEKIAVEEIGKIRAISVKEEQLESVPEYSGSLQSASLQGVLEASDGRRLEAAVSLDVKNATEFDMVEFSKSGDELVISEREYGDLFGLAGVVDELDSIDYFDNDGYYLNNTTLNYNSETNDVSYNLSFRESIYTKTVIEEEGYHALQERRYDGIIDALVKEQFGSDAEVINYDVIYSGANAQAATTSYTATVKLPDYETADNFLKATVTADIDLALNDLPGSKLVLTADRNALNGASVEASFIEMNGDSSIERFKAVVSSTGSDENITFKKADGTALVITPSEEGYEGVVAADGVEVGHIEKRDDAYIIVWKDGSFETLM